MCKPLPCLCGSWGLLFPSHLGQYLFEVMIEAFYSDMHGLGDLHGLSFTLHSRGNGVGILRSAKF